MNERKSFEKLSPGFYRRDDVLLVARELLGKILVSRFEEQLTSGLITEVEAYRAPDDRACHAWNNRRTARTEVMFREGGTAYIYLCYGIHHLFNVVTAPADVAHAILIRAVEPLEGLDIMAKRRNIRPSVRLTTGPGAMSQALGLTTAWTGQSLTDPRSPVWIENRGHLIMDEQIAVGPRIGVDYAGECAAWEWRFWLRDSAFVSRKKQI